MNRTKIDQLTEKFREKYGDGQTLALGIAATNLLLISKGICTEEEFYTVYVAELEKRMKRLNKREDVPK